MDQSDIDALMNDMPDPEGEGSSGAADAAPADRPTAESPTGESQTDESQTDESQTDDTVVSQDDLDGLLREAQQLTGDEAESASPEAAEAPGALDSTGKPLDEAGAAMAAAIAEEQAAAASAVADDAPPPAANDVELEEIQLPDFDVNEVAQQANQPLSLLYDVEMHVKIELGRTNMYVEDVLKLGEGSVVELDRLAGDPVDVFVNGRLVARGEVLVLNDNFCVRVSEVISDPKARLAG